MKPVVFTFLKAGCEVGWRHTVRLENIKRWEELRVKYTDGTEQDIVRLHLYDGVALDVADVDRHVLAQLEHHFNDAEWE